MKTRNALAFLSIILLIEIGVYLAIYKYPIQRESKSTLASILEKGTLTVLTRNAPTTYYQGPVGPVGYEYELVSYFAKHLNVSLQIKTVDDTGEILRAINNGEADMAVAGIVKTEKRNKAHVFGPVYYSVRQQVVYRRGSKRPHTVSDLSGLRILVKKGSHYEARLKELHKDHPSLTWASTDQLSIEEILEKVWKKEFDCTLADSNIIAMNRRYYPELAVAFSLNKQQPLGWVLKPGSHRLRFTLTHWFAEFRASGKLSEITDHYFKNTALLNYVDIKIFHRRIKTRLPRLMPMFLDASVQFQLPWELIAAQAYQESHWDNQAESPTGVRGIMMLTEETAQYLGVEDRLDPQKSITGGAAYLASLLKRIPETVTEENRTKFALAAYNVGMGHIYDARQLTEMLEKNPNSWSDLQETLPLLTQKEYYKHLKNGYARGMEPVQYVSAIYTYKDILEKYFLLF